QIDSWMIGITTGLMSALFITPLVVWIFTRIKMLKSVLLGMLLTLSVYMLGLVYKEYLSIYIVKGVFIMVAAFIAYTIVYLRQQNKKLILLLLIDFIMLLFHPFTSYFSYLLAFKFILLLLSIYYFEEKTPIVFHRRIINGLIIGSVISLAFYASNKGLGYGILICFSAPLFHFITDNQYYEGWKNVLYKTFPIVLFCILIFSIYLKLGILTLFCVSLTGCFLTVFKEITISAFCILFFGMILPFVSILYLALFFSKAYAIFSGSIVLISLLLYHFSDDIKKLES
ncbi:MAG: hypothetical protein M9887_03890, partial [Chitinophagales bacterium]|nr:hypothetical protein [Chitinophagales bacterium]